MLSDIYLLSCNCLYSDLKFQPTCCPSRKGSFQWFRSVRPYYSGDKPYRYLTGFPKTKGIKSDFRYSVIKVQKIPAKWQGM